MTKDLGYYLSLKYPYTIEEEENGKINYVLEIPDLPGCWAEGKNLDKARANLEEAKSLWIEEGLKRRIQIPEPSKEFSGRILLRIPPVLHGQLNKHARKAVLSLNQFIRNLLEAGINFSSVLERFDGMEKKIQGIEEQLRLQNRMERYTVTGAARHYVETNVWTSIIATKPYFGATEGKTFVDAELRGSIYNAGFQYDPISEKKKEEVATL